MNIKNCLNGLIVVAVISLTYSADTTASQVSPKPVATISTLKNDAAADGLKKQKTVIKPTSTWTKIKDLFM